MVFDFLCFGWQHSYLRSIMQSVYELSVRAPTAVGPVGCFRGPCLRFSARPAGICRVAANALGARVLWRHSNTVLPYGRQSNGSLCSLVKEGKTHALSAARKSGRCSALSPAVINGVTAAATLWTIPLFALVSTERTVFESVFGLHRVLALRRGGLRIAS